MHSIPPPNPELLLSPLLASLPAASISPSPPDALLPHLSPILRQRVQVLSASTQDPWLPLLCYNASHLSQLENAVKNERFEPHPVSGEVEIDYATETSIQYKRLDSETLQSLISLEELGLAVKLIYCINDEGDGWRIGEVDTTDSTTSKWGYSSIPLAENAFQTSSQTHFLPRTNGRLPTPDHEKEEEDEDDDYWAQYDNTPARTPAPKDTAPSHAHTSGGLGVGDGNDEDSYYAQYASVQPAMDNHDPDEAMENGEVESSLGRDEITSELKSHLASSSSQNLPPAPATEMEHFVAHPRPSSSHGSSGSDTVARLEKAVEEEASQSSNRDSSELGIKQHIGTSIKSLWRLARVAGIEKEEFERVVKTELELIGLMGDDD